MPLSRALETAANPRDIRTWISTIICSVQAERSHARDGDVVTDGEWRRKSYIGVIAELAHGFEESVQADGRPWTVVVDRLSPKNPGFIAQEGAFVRSISNRGVKATLPSPALLGERMWDPRLSIQAYASRKDFVRATIPILRRELELLQKAGASIVQIDDPHLCLFVDPNFRASFANPEEEIQFGIDTLNELVGGIRGLKIAVHLCRRAGARVRGEQHHQGSFDSIIPYLNQLQVHHLTMEFTAEGSGDPSVLHRLREDLEIGLGCVSVQPGQVDTAETIVERVQSALRFVSAERITLNPDCGFAPGSAAAVDLEEVYCKLKQEVAAAVLLRQRHH